MVASPAEIPSQSSKLQAWLGPVSIATAASVFALVVLGGVVRVTESGLGCPDWPLCYGSIIPPLEMTAIIEYTHRLVASAIVSPLVILTFVLVWLAHRKKKWLVLPAAVSVVFLVAQALLGGVTVLTELPGPVVASHLALGQALLGCLIWIAVLANHRGFRQGAGIAVLKGFPMLSVLAAGAVYLLILSGSVVTATNATGACITWPLCQGQIFPSSSLAMIHMAHRIVALVLGLFMLYVVHLGFRDAAKPRGIRRLSMAVAGFFTVQVLVGAFMVWGGFQPFMLALHLSVSAVVWALMVAVATMSLTNARGGATPAGEGAHG